MARRSETPPSDRYLRNNYAVARATVLLAADGWELVDAARRPNGGAADFEYQFKRRLN